MLGGTNCEQWSASVLVYLQPTPVRSRDYGDVMERMAYHPLQVVACLINENVIRAETSL
jgi:hypothetical protein